MPTLLILPITLGFGLIAVLAASLPAQEDPKPPYGRLSVLSSESGNATPRRLLRGGFPFAENEGVRDPSQLVLVDAATGARRPARIRALSRWGKPANRGDAPLRWVSVETTGRPGEVLLIRTRGEGESDSASFQRIEDEAGVSLLSPELTLRLARGRDLLRSLESRTAADGATGPGLRLIAEDPAGRALDVAPWSIEVIGHGEEAAEVIARTEFAGLRAERRLRLAAGTEEIIIDLRIVNAGAYGWGKTKAATRYLGRVALTLPVPLGTERVAVDEIDVPVDAIGSGLFLLQGHQVKKSGKSRRESLRREVWRNGRATPAQPNAPGRMRFLRGPIAHDVVVERFAELAPKALGSDGRSAVFEFFPRGGNGPHYRGRYGRPNKGEVDARALEGYRIEGGRAHSVRLRLHRRNADANLTGAASVYLLPERARVAATAALGLSLPAPRQDDPTLRRFERLLETFVSDAAADDVPSLGRIGLPAFRARGGTYGDQVFYGWFNWGDLPWGDGYCSLHYDLPGSILTAALRREDVRFLDLGEDMARHRRDVDQDHSEDPQDRARGGQFYEKGFWHGNFESPKLSHTWLRGPILHWWLTGDPWSREAAELGRAFIRRQTPEKWNGRYGARVPGWTLDNLVACWEAFGRTEDLSTARALAARVASFEAGRGFIINPAAKPKAWKPWMHSILALGVGRLRPHAPEVAPLHNRLLKALETRAVAGTAESPSVYRHHDGRQGREPSLHLLWPAIAAWSTAPDSKEMSELRRRAAVRFRYVLDHHQGRSSNPLSFRLEGFPGSESKVLSNIALFGQASLELFGH